ncbi:MAG: universal stress protein [Chloroflexi bacterium]|nr:universal stress protein [Chloroflexota bacterium]
MKTMLVPLDGSPLSETVLPVVTALAGSGKYRVTLLSIWEVLPEEVQLVGERHVRKLREQGMKCFRAYLANIAETLAKQGIEVTTEVRSGHPAAEILAVSGALKPDVVAMASKGCGGEETYGRRGSVAEKILHASALPVLVLGPRLLESWPPTEVGVSSILVPLDGSAASEAALPTAVEIASETGAQVSLLRVVPPIPTHALVGPSEAYSPKIDERRQQAALDYLKDVQRHFPEILREVFVERGRPRQEIRRFIEQQGIDLVVMASRSRYDSQQWRLGGVADAVIESKAPVLLVPPVQ